MKTNSKDLNEILQVSRLAAEAGRQILLHYFGDLKRVSEKAQAGLVSEADLESEKAICKVILEHFPEHRILAEEAAFEKLSKGLAEEESESESEVRWLIDPLDGTTNYIHQFPVFCISIGVEIAGQIVCALVDAPKMNQVFTAVRGQGSFLNDQKIRVSSRSELKDSLLVTGFFAYEDELVKKQMAVFERFIKETRGVRRVGSAAYDLCLVAQGVFDGFWERGLQPWDTAAGSLLVTEAGGVVSDYLGKDYRPEGPTILASNPTLYQELQSTLEEIEQPQV